MQDNTSWTPSPEENLLNLTEKNAINEQEAKGIAMAELYLFQLETDKVLQRLFLKFIKQPLVICPTGPENGGQ